MFKKILKILGLLILAVVITCAGMIAIEKIGMLIDQPLPQEQFDGLAGTLGLVPTAAFLGILAHKKGWFSDLKDHKTKLDLRAIPLSLFAISAGTILTGTAAALLFGRLFPVTPAVGDHSIISLISAVIIAPLTEEFIFRVGVHGMLRKTFPIKVAMVIQAAIFAAIHFYSLQGTLEAFAVGIILAILFEKTGNIFYSIIAHMALNIFANVSNALVRRGIPFYTEPNGYLIYHVAVIAAAVVIVVVTAVIIRKGKVKSVQSSCS